MLVALPLLIAFAIVRLHAEDTRGQLLPLGTLPDTTLPAGAQVERGVRYGEDAAQLLDVYLPAAQAGTTTTPAIVLVHGGGWRRGGRDNRGLAAPKAAHWLPRGIAVVSVDYRLLPDADPLQQADDVARAVAYVQQHATRWRIDPARIVLVGHSAGAHLVSLLGSDPSALRAAGAMPVRGVVALDSAVFDLPALMRARHLPLYDNAFGTDPDVWQRASPHHRLRAGVAPLLAVCSSRRHDACPQARAYAARARSFGVRVEVLPQDLSHMQLNRELGGDSAFTRAVDGFIERVLAAR